MLGSGYTMGWCGAALNNSICVAVSLVQHRLCINMWQQQPSWQQLWMVYCINVIANGCSGGNVVGNSQRMATN